MLVNVVHKNKEDMSKLLFLLISITYGLVNLKNLKLIGGIEYLESLWHAKVLDEDTLIARFSTVKFHSPGYDTNKSISCLHPLGTFVAGFARLLMRLQGGLVKDIARDLNVGFKHGYSDAQWTLKVLSTTAGLPSFVALITGRYLGALSLQYGHDDEFDTIGLGAVPTIDFLAGDDVNWAGCTIDSHVKTKRRSYVDIARASSAVLQACWKDCHGPAPGNFLPPYIKPNVQLVQTNCCEFRKDACEAMRSIQQYVSSDSTDMPYKDHLVLFETCFVHGLEGIPWLNVTMRTAASTSSGIVANAADTAAALKKLAVPPEVRSKEYAFRHGNKIFMTLSRYYEIVGFTRNTLSKRQIIATYVFADEDVLCYYGAALNTVDSKYLQYQRSVEDNHDFALQCEPAPDGKGEAAVRLVNVGAINRLLTNSSRKKGRKS